MPLGFIDDTPLGAAPALPAPTEPGAVAHGGGDEGVQEGTTFRADSAKRDGECTCAFSPPCAWCVSLDEEEADAYGGGGRDALEALWAAREEATNANAPGCPGREDIKRLVVTEYRTFRGAVPIFRLDPPLDPPINDVGYVVRQARGWFCVESVGGDWLCKNPVDLTGYDLSAAEPAPSCEGCISWRDEQDNRGCDHPPDPAVSDWITANKPEPGPLAIPGAPPCPGRVERRGTVARKARRLTDMPKWLRPYATEGESQIRATERLAKRVPGLEATITAEQARHERVVATTIADADASKQRLADTIGELRGFLKRAEEDRERGIDEREKLRADLEDTKHDVALAFDVLGVPVEQRVGLSMAVKAAIDARVREHEEAVAALEARHRVALSERARTFDENLAVVGDTAAILRGERDRARKEADRLTRESTTLRELIDDEVATRKRLQVQLDAARASFVTRLFDALVLGLFGDHALYTGMALGVLFAISAALVAFFATFGGG